MRWYTSDSHFSHRRIIELADRNFADIEAMNEALVKNWNSAVSPDDTVFHLGDVALGQIHESLAYVSRLNGHKHLIMGNHDRCFPGSPSAKGKPDAYWRDIYHRAGFETIQMSLLLPLAPGLDLALSHFPYEGDHTEQDRWTEHRLIDQGIPLLHGHTHSREQVSYSPAGTLQINTGVEAWDYTPVSEGMIFELIRANR